MRDWNETERRILAVMGPDDAPRDELLERWHRHLASELELPCHVTGIEDFQWEERYLMGAGRHFVLGLSELEVVDQASKNHQLLDDYAVWFVNSR
jgi:hypothetical protein